MTVSLRPVTIRNWQQVIALKVRDDQADFVASNLYSLAEAHFGFDYHGYWSLTPLAIYAGKRLVGFTMYAVNYSYEPFQYIIMRLMIDAEHQGRGYGKAAMQLLLERIAADPGATTVAISYDPSNEAARQLYAQLGFVETGVIEHETLATRKLRE